jgi:hypothetical protein
MFQPSSNVEHKVRVAATPPTLWYLGPEPDTSSMLNLSSSPRSCLPSKVWYWFINTFRPRSRNGRRLRCLAFQFRLNLLFLDRTEGDLELRTREVILLAGLLIRPSLTSKVGKTSWLQTNARRRSTAYALADFTNVPPVLCSCLAHNLHALGLSWILRSLVASARCLRPSTPILNWRKAEEKIRVVITNSNNSKSTVGKKNCTNQIS